MLLLSLPIKSREWLARDVMNTLTLIPTLFFASLIQTAGHKMAALRSSFPDIQTSKQKSTRNRVKKMFSVWDFVLHACSLDLVIFRFDSPLIN